MELEITYAEEYHHTSDYMGAVIFKSNDCDNKGIIFKIEEQDSEVFFFNSDGFERITVNENYETWEDIIEEYFSFYTTVRYIENMEEIRNITIEFE